MRQVVVACLCLLIVFVGHSARAENQDAFVERVRAAYRAPDKMAALKNLFYLANVDNETLLTYERRIIGRMLGKYVDPEVTLEPLPKDFNSLQVIGAYEYRPNLEPLGFVVLAERTKVPYGAISSPLLPVPR
jgi:hypothetical protein